MADLDEDVEWYRREVGEDPTEEDLKAFKAARAQQGQKKEKFHPTTFKKRKKAGDNENENEEQEEDADQPPAKKQKLNENKSKFVSKTTNQQPKKGILKNANTKSKNKINAKQSKK